MKKRIISILAVLALIMSTIPMLGMLTATAASTAVWVNGGVSIDSSNVGYTDLGNGFVSLECSDMRGSITAPDLDDHPYYLQIGMPTQFATGHWVHFQISSGERNCNWYANHDIYIIFPNPAAVPKNVTVVNNRNNPAQTAGVPYVEGKIYTFKFAKEQNAAGTDVLVVYCDGVKMFEGADELAVFEGSKLWFTTKGNTGASDTFSQYPIVINPETGLTEDPIIPTAEWWNGGLSITGVQGYSDMGNGFTRLECTDARGCIDTPDLDKGPYYLLAGMTDQFVSGHWAQLQLSSGERNYNWYANHDIYIIFPNPAANPKNITIINNKGAAAQTAGVPFMPKTAYVFKFAKEQNAAGTDVLVIYCNGVKMFEGAEELAVFEGSKLWFTTKGNTGANDTFSRYPLFLNPENGMTEDPEYYFTTGPKAGCDGYSAYTSDVIADNMIAEYAKDGSVRAIVDCTHNDGGNPAQVGESVSANIPNPNKQIELKVTAEDMTSGNWATIGIYDPATGNKALAQGAEMLRLNLNGAANNALYYYYAGNASETLISASARVKFGTAFKVRVALIDGADRRIEVYYNDVLQTTVRESDANMAGLFTLMEADTLRVGIVGHKNAADPNVIRFAVSNGIGVSVADTANGTLTASQPYDGVVTVTVTPDEGYQLKAGSLKYNGKPLTVRVGRGTDETVCGQYQFQMPEANVEITAEFISASADNVAVLGASAGKTADTAGAMRLVSRAARNVGDKHLTACGTYLLRADGALGATLTAGAALSAEQIAALIPAEAGVDTIRKIPTTVLNDRCDEYVEFCLRVNNAANYGDAEYIAIAYAEYCDGTVAYSAPVARSYGAIAG